MTYAGIQIFMDKLNQLINCSDNPSIDIPSIRRKRPQFRLLYEQLGSLIQTLFIEEHQHLPELDNMKKRFIDAAEEAQYTVDLFLSGVHLRKRRPFGELFLSRVGIMNINGNSFTSRDFNPSLNLDDVMKSFESIKVEYNSRVIDESSPSPAAGISYARSSLRSKKLLDEVLIVGFDDDAGLIRDKLVEDQKKLDVVSIVGMGGIGKTTLATKVFNDRFVKHHFHVRVWVTVSQRYDKRDVLIQILESIRGQLDLEKDTDSRLREKVHKHLMGKRYLIVIDDIWHIQTWDKVKLFFPHENIASRILLTSRLTEVAKHASLGGFVHQLGYMNKEKSWELLCQKVFHGNEFPEWSIKPGMRIVENCKGLPLSVVVIGGILVKEAWSKELWEEIAERTGSYIVGEQNGCLETLALSYNHLPLHLRECFLYLGGFPEDQKFHVQRLITLWMAEGFIKQAGNQSLEDIALSYLMDLIDRSLVIVSGRRKSNGGVRACILHDLVRELCLRKAKEEGLILEIQTPMLSSDAFTPQYKPVRMFTNKDINIPIPSGQNLRSIIAFSSDFGVSVSEDIAKYFRTFRLLRVLDLQRCSLNDLPRGIELLVHLRYLAIWKDSEGFPSSICNLWGLQTLIYITRQFPPTLPRNISDLVNLRHLWNYLPFSVGVQSFKMPFFMLSIEKPMNLQSISNVVLSDKGNNFQKCFPYIKELKCSTYADDECNFKSLTCLEKLKLTDERSIRTNCITYPTTLRALVLYTCNLPCSHMSVIQSLPNLQVLKLKFCDFEGGCWNTDGQEFQQLKFLRLEGVNIKQWEACTASFLCLRQLEIYSCPVLEGIPLQIGEIPTLELIRISNCGSSVDESVRKIIEEQNDLGNYDLKIEFRRKWWS